MLKLPGGWAHYVPALRLAKLAAMSVEVEGSQQRDFSFADGGLISRVHAFSDVNSQSFDRLFKIFSNTP